MNEWVLTDEELKALDVPPGVIYDGQIQAHAIADAQGKKALEWAAKRCETAKTFGSNDDPRDVCAAAIREGLK